MKTHFITVIGYRIQLHNNKYVALQLQAMSKYEMNHSIQFIIVLFYYLAAMVHCRSPLPPLQVYKAGVHPRFPNGGKMSQHLDSLQIGDTIDVRGPEGKVTYLGRGT